MLRATRLLVPLLGAALVAAGLGWAGPVTSASAIPVSSVTPFVATKDAAPSPGAPVGSRYTPVNTARVFSGSVGTSPVVVPIAGQGGIASNATAVVVTVEVSNPTAAGYVRVTTAGSDPSVATQEFTRGQTISNLATVSLTGGKIQVKLSAGSATVFMDVSGYYSGDSAASTYSPVTNFRTFGGTVGTTPVQVPIAGIGSVPSTATAVAVNTEVSNPTANGYVRVTPAGQDPSVAAQVFSAGRTISTLVIAKLSSGAVQVKVSAGSATVFMDVSGYYSPSSTGSVFVPLDTTRAYAGGVSTSPRQINLAGTAGVPGAATGVVVNAEVEQPSASGYVRLTPAGTDAPVAAQVFASNQTISNLVMSKVANKAVQAKVSAGSATLYLDVSGYFIGANAGTGLGNDISWPQCGGPYPAGQAFGIVGVNNGLANNTNPCLDNQIAWAQASLGGTAQPKVALYVLGANPGLASASWPTSNQYPAGTAVTNPYGTCTGTVTSACAYMYGYARAYDDVNSRGVTSPTSYRWWLDIETESTWSKTQASNVADIEGMAAYFTKVGASVGIYSTNAQWKTIAGTVSSTSPLSTLPNWIALGTTTLATAQAACSGAPLMRGKITMTQYISGGFDYNNSCI